MPFFSTLEEMKDYKHPFEQNHEEEKTCTRIVYETQPTMMMHPHAVVPFPTMSLRDPEYYKRSCSHMACERAPMYCAYNPIQSTWCPLCLRRKLFPERCQGL